MTTDEAIKRLEERMEQIRKEDKDIRHERNKAQDRAMDSMWSRIVDLETQCKEQYAVCDKTEQSVDRLLKLMQGDPGLGSDGFLVRQKQSLEEINGKIGALESDKSESRTHRQQHADIPARVSSLEKSRTVQRVQIRTIGWLGGILTGALGIYLGFRDFFRGGP